MKNNDADRPQFDLAAFLKKYGLEAKGTITGGTALRPAG
jgi:hypothetical protein